MKPVRRTRTAAALALLCLAALLCGDAARGIHLLTARHVVCAAHGELVEADSPEGEIGSDEGGVTAAPTPADADHHDHCSVAAVPTRSAAAGIRGALFSNVAPSAESIVVL